MLQVDREYPWIELEHVVGDNDDLIGSHGSHIRNAGFAYALKMWKDCQYLMTFDDDTAPVGDPIQDHLDALNSRVPISWFSHASRYMRGFPYGIRSEAPVMASVGVWEGSRDYDAPSQLVNGNLDATFYRGPVPKGSLTTVCGMNFAFRRAVAPYVFFDPTAGRFDDILMGIRLKRKLDERNEALVTGMATVRHDRASDVFVNLEKEAPGIRQNELGEQFWKPTEQCWRWEQIMKQWV